MINKKMNFAQKLVMNNVKSQAENLIPKEVKDAIKNGFL